MNIQEKEHQSMPCLNWIQYSKKVKFFYQKVSRYLSYFFSRNRHCRQYIRYVLISIVIWFLLWWTGLNDGAAALVLCSNRTVKLKHHIPLAKIISWAQTGIDPLVMVIIFLFVKVSRILFFCLGHSTNKNYSRSFT